MRRVVEHCENWMEMSLIHGRHCWNCVMRKGYPYRAQPDKNCENFKLVKKLASNKGMPKEGE